MYFVELTTTRPQPWPSKQVCQSSSLNGINGFKPTLNFASRSKRTANELDVISGTAWAFGDYGVCITSNAQAISLPAEGKIPPAKVKALMQASNR
jgi:hypothetical protein